MGRRDDKRKIKLCVLGKIKENRHVLFGAFDQKLTKEDKAKVWKEINQYAQSIGAVLVTKEWSYTRDVWWPNARKLAMEKIDNAHTTGSGGGKDVIHLTDVEMEILDIIGKDSPSVEGLHVEESTNLKTVISNSNLLLSESSSIQDLEENNESLTSNPPTTTTTAIRKPMTKCQPKKPLTDKLTETKKELQVELLKIQIYKSKLECRKLEIEMGMAPSTQTSSIEANPMILLHEQPNVLIVNNDEENACVNENN